MLDSVRLRARSYLDNRLPMAILQWPFYRLIFLRALGSHGSPNHAGIRQPHKSRTFGFCNCHGEKAWYECPTILPLVAQTVQHGMRLQCAVAQWY